MIESCLLKPKVLPNFFVIGAPKCGTTTLADIIQQHPEAFVPSVKEPGYFIPDRGIKRERDYLRLFRYGVQAKAIGEASTDYLFEPLVAEAIQSFNSDAKIICILRNPVDMVYSFWRFQRALNDERKKFEVAISDIEQRYRHSEDFKEVARPTWKAYVYLDRAMYAKQLRVYYRKFSRERIKVLFLEELIANPEVVVREVYEFLEISTDFRPIITKFNSGGEPRFDFIRRLRSRRYPVARKVLPFWLLWHTRRWLGEVNRIRQPGGNVQLDADLRSKLARHFYADVAELESQLERKIDCWVDFSNR